MTPEERSAVVSTLLETWRRYPEWRFGQLVANVASWAGREVWDVEDDQLQDAARQQHAAADGRTLAGRAE